MQDNVFRGCLPALMTPCSASGVPDFNHMVDTAKGLMEAGMGGVVYCGSMGDWVLLTDDQRQRGVEALVGADIPVVVGTGAFTPALACAHAAHAADVGASGLMVIPRVLSRGTSSAAQRTHFSDVLTAGSGLPSVIYNSPYYGFETKADLFFDLRAQHDNLVGYKEFGGRAALSYAAEHITSATEDLMLLVGVDTQVVHGIVDCGAVGVITGVGNVLPVAVLRLVELSREAAAGDPGSHRLALELERALATLSLFDEGPDLVLYYKHLAVLAGDNAYTESLHGSDTLSDSQKRYATDQFEQFDRWWSAWSGSASKPAVMVPPDFA